MHVQSFVTGDIYTVVISCAVLMSIPVLTLGL